MLLTSEIEVGKVYIRDASGIFNRDGAQPRLYRLAEAVETTGESIFDPMEVIKHTRYLWEDIKTGELERYGTHILSDIQRIKRQYENKSALSPERRETVEFMMELIEQYEGTKEPEVEDHQFMLEVGDQVMFRTWEDLLAEYGESKQASGYKGIGEQNCILLDEEKEFCGQYNTVSYIDRGIFKIEGHNGVFSMDVINPAVVVKRENKGGENVYK